MNIENISLNSNPQNPLSSAYAQEIDFSVRELDLNKMGLTSSFTDILETLIILARKAKTVSQKYISEASGTSLKTTSRAIVFLQRARYIEAFYNDQNDICLSYRINFKDIFEFLKESFKKAYQKCFYNITQWLGQNDHHIISLHSSLINKEKGTKSKSCAKTAFQYRKKEKVLLDLDNGRKEQVETTEPRQINPKSKIKSKSLGEIMGGMTSKALGNFGKKNKPKSSCYQQSEVDKLMASIMGQCKENRKTLPPEKIFIPKEIKKPIEKQKPSALNEYEKNCIGELKKKFGADDYTAKVAMENAKLNKNIRFPLRQVTSSKAAYEVNLDQGLKQKEIVSEARDFKGCDIVELAELANKYSK